MSHGVEGKATRSKVTATVAERVAEVMQALAGESRVRILAELRDGPRSVTELVTELGAEQSAVSHQLKLLRDTGLVVAEREGRRRIYSLYDDHVALLIDQAVWHTEHLGLGASEGASGERTSKNKSRATT